MLKLLIEREYAAQKSEEWLALRGNMLTASDAATAIGKNKYETPCGLLLKKCGLGEKFTGNAATRHGEKSMKMRRGSSTSRDMGKLYMNLVSVPIPYMTGWWKS